MQFVIIGNKLEFFNDKSAGNKYIEKRLVEHATRRPSHREKISMDNCMKYVFVVLAAFFNFSYLGTANAVNWLTLQGVTDSPYPLVWGFLQPSYFKTSGTALPTGPWQGQQAMINVIQPDLSSSQVFQIQRARVGVRGALPENDKISYFLLAEYGNNGITQPGAGAGKVTLTDASVTFTQINGAKIRIGQMKVPMSEEVYQGILAVNYINLTNMANQQLIERPLWTDGKANCFVGTPPGPSNALYLRYCNGDAQTQFRSSSVAASDIGIQIFDSFKHEAWEYSYALLVGQGGTNKDDRNNSLDKTIYLAAEKVFDGERAFRKGYKLYAWRTGGKRTIYDSSTLAAGASSLEEAERDYDRTLGGIGGTYFDGKYRFWAEYIKADGMIFIGSTGGAIPGSVNNTGNMVAQFITEPEGKGDGAYLDFGYRIIPDIELDIRYDWYNRVTNRLPTDEFKFKTWTLGAQYFFTKTTKAIVNYEKRSVKAVGYPSSSMANEIADATDNRISAQLFLFF